MPSFISIVGYSNSGKTTFICGLLQELTSRSYSATVIKHDPENHGIYDSPGKDTDKFWEAGAEGVFLSSSRQFLFRKKVDREIKPEELAEICNGADIVVLEGYKKYNYPCIQIVASKGDAFLAKGQLVALVTEGKKKHDVAVPCFNHNDYPGVVDLLEKKGIIVKRRI